MSDSTPTSVVSGITYPVMTVAGRACEELTDFLGDTEFTIDNDGPYTAKGCGRATGDSVRFYEKGRDGSGRDIRVWRIGRASDGTFTAEHAVPL
jgi:hypothetical protein